MCADCTFYIGKEAFMQNKPAFAWSLILWKTRAGGRGRRVTAGNEEMGKGEVSARRKATHLKMRENFPWGMVPPRVTPAVTDAGVLAARGAVALQSKAAMFTCPTPSGRVRLVTPQAEIGGLEYTGRPSSSAISVPVPPEMATLEPLVFAIHVASVPFTGGSGESVKD
jgi:hypothetical protein